MRLEALESRLEGLSNKSAWAFIAFVSKRLWRFLCTGPFLTSTSPFLTLLVRFVVSSRTCTSPFFRVRFIHLFFDILEYNQGTTLWYYNILKYFNLMFSLEQIHLLLFPFGRISCRCIMFMFTCFAWWMLIMFHHMMSWHVLIIPPSWKGVILDSDSSDPKSCARPSVCNIVITSQSSCSMIARCLNL